MKKILSILLTLAMVFTIMFPNMNVIVKAEGVMPESEFTEELKSICNKVDDDADDLIANIFGNEVSFSDLISALRGESFLEVISWFYGEESAYDETGFTKINDTYTWHSEVFDTGMLYTIFTVTLDGENVKSVYYKHWDERSTNGEFLFVAPHSHSWAYAADGATLYAYCTSEEGCDYQGSATDLSKALTLTIAKAFTDSNYNGLPNIAIFDYDKAAEWKTVTGEDAPTITYEAKSGSKLTEVEGEMCAVKIGSYTAKATIGSATATFDFEITRKEHSEVVDKVIDFDETDWEYRFYLDGTYTSDVTGDAVGDVSSLRFYNCSDDVVSYVGAPLESTIIGGHSMKVTTATISYLTAGIPNVAGIKCEYDATAHTLKITPISAAVIHKDINDFEVTSDSVSKTFTQGQTSASTIHIAGLKIDNMNKVGDDYKGILVMNGSVVLTQGTDYTVTEGSVKVNLAKSYLDKLPVGTHNIKVYVKQNDVATATDKDYEFDANVIINAKSNPTPQPEPTPETPSRPIYKVPNTGVVDTTTVMSSNGLIEIGALALGSVIGLISTRKKKRR